MPYMAYDYICRTYEYCHLNVSSYSVNVNTIKQLHTLIISGGKYHSYAT
jgi:hypothetical protein